MAKRSRLLGLLMTYAELKLEMHSLMFFITCKGPNNLGAKLQ
jgi:hypothetical protein